MVSLIFTLERYKWIKSKNFLINRHCLTIADEEEEDDEEEEEEREERTCVETDFVFIDFVRR